jgi:hypothetical protein
MWKFKVITVLICLSFMLPLVGGSVFAGNIPYARDDRDRLIRLEEGQKALLKQIESNTLFLQKQITDTRTLLQKQITDTRTLLQKQITDTREVLQKQIDNLRVFMLWGFGILFGGMGILIGFVIWDRRTALSPVQRKNRELEEREEMLERAFRELARRDQKVAEVLKQVGLM